MCVRLGQYLLRLKQNKKPYFSGNSFLVDLVGRMLVPSITQYSAISLNFHYWLLEFLIRMCFFSRKKSVSELPVMQLITCSSVMVPVAIDLPHLYIVIASGQLPLLHFCNQWRVKPWPGYSSQFRPMPPRLWRHWHMSCSLVKVKMYKWVMHCQSATIAR